MTVLNLKIGDKVKSLISFDGKDTIVGKIGKVVETADGAGYVGVEFEENVGGHNCCKKAKEGHGWYIIDNSDYLQLVEELKVKAEEVNEERVTMTKFDEKVIITLEGRKTTVELENGSIGTSVAVENDDYNQEVGIAIAWAKALIASNKTILEGHQNTLIKTEREVRLRKREIESLKNDIKRIGG